MQFTLCMFLFFRTIPIVIEDSSSIPKSGDTVDQLSISPSNGGGSTPTAPGEPNNALAK